MLQSKTQRSLVGKQAAMHFGLFLKTLRHRHGIRQLQVLAHLPGWTQTTYSRLESGEIAPAFDQLAAIYTALHQAGVELTPPDRQQFLLLARKRIDVKKTYQEHKTEQDWEQLRLRLSRVGDTGSALFAGPAGRLSSRPRLVETRHLVGREGWLSSIIALLQETLPKKLIVLQGPIGIGKSSELHRLALYFLRQDTPRIQVILCDLPSLEPETGPETALDLFLGNLLAEIGPAEVAQQLPSLEARTTFALQYLEKTARPLLLLLDNAERLLDERGALATCWEQFLLRFLRSQHRASLVIATREWPGWQEGERIFLSEQMLPPLAPETGALLLQNLGLTTVPLAQLRKASEVVGGIPLCLEWIASLVQEPMLLDSWEGLDDLDEQTGEDAEEDAQTQRLLRLLEDASLFRGPIASKLKPLLERIIQARLSAEAVQVLYLLAIANIPLGKPALQKLCPRPRLLHELRAASLLVAYPQRIQLLPMVASLVRARLTTNQQRHLEEQLIEALTCWLDKGTMSHAEAGAIISELAIFYLKHHRLLDAAELLIRYGWLSFNQGHAPHLAQLAMKSLQEFDWHGNEENECGELILYNYLTPHLGKSPNSERRFADYQAIYKTVLAENITLHSITEGHITNGLMQYTMNKLCFEEAQALLKVHLSRLEPLQADDLELQMSLLEKQAWFFGRWCEYTQEQGNLQKERELREKAISFYKQCSALLPDREDFSPLKKSLLRRRLARAFNNLAYHLHRMGQFEEALQAVEQAIALRELGYAELGGLAVSYGEKSEILVELGHFQEALFFDNKALEEIQRCANTGYTLLQEEVWIYRVNRGRLYLRLGRVVEAEQILRDALPHIPLRRRTYRMFAENALREIEQWRQRATSPQYQLDWRWVERLRELDAFDAYWWWAHAGPFTDEEQQQWDQLFTSNLDADTKSQLGELLSQSRERELAAAIRERREPYLRYPTIDIEEVRCRINALLQLDTEINQEEPNAIVRRLYHEKIEEEIWFLRMIEATYEGNNKHFWQFSRYVYPEPTPEEMNYAFSHVWQILMRGLQHSETLEVSQQLIQFMHERLQFSENSLSNITDSHKGEQNNSVASSQPQQMVTAQAAKRFFETVLQESGYEKWQVVIDTASTTRVEAGLRRLFLANSPMSVERVRYYLTHELVGHVARSMAGERSLLGLLGVGTKNYSPTEEGLALYHERQIAALHGQELSDWGTWLGTLSTGMASGVATPPQTFLSLFTFLESLFLLRRLLAQQDKDMQTAQEKARKTALANCLRIYRGVPNLTEAGVCLTKDVVYLRGLQMIERAAAQDQTILDRLAVGKVALEYLPDLQELGITSYSQPLAKLAHAPDLDAYILSFEKGQSNEST